MTTYDLKYFVTINTWIAREGLRASQPNFPFILLISIGEK